MSPSLKSRNEASSAAISSSGSGSGCSLRLGRGRPLGSASCSTGAPLPGPPAPPRSQLLSLVTHTFSLFPPRPTLRRGRVRICLRRGTRCPRAEREVTVRSENDAVTARGGVSVGGRRLGLPRHPSRRRRARPPRVPPVLHPIGNDCCLLQPHPAPPRRPAHRERSQPCGNPSSRRSRRASSTRIMAHSKTSWRCPAFGAFNGPPLPRPPPSGSRWSGPCRRMVVPAQPRPVHLGAEGVRGSSGTPRSSRSRISSASLSAGCRDAFHACTCSCRTPALSSPSSRVGPSPDRPPGSPNNGRGSDGVDVRPRLLPGEMGEDAELESLQQLRGTKGSTWSG